MVQMNQEPNQRSPTPTDWQHAGILMARTMRTDKKKWHLWAARFLAPPLIFMLYTIGLFMGYQDFDGGYVAGPYQFYNGKDFTYPEKIRIGGFDSDFVDQVVTSLADQQGTANSIISNTGLVNATLLSLECAGNIAWTAAEEICVFFDSIDSYTLLYGGKEAAMPFQEALAGAQWAINSALASLSNTIDTSMYFSIEKIQPSPTQILPETLDIPLVVILLPACMFVLAVLIMSQFLLGPITYEKVNHVAKSYVQVGVKFRTYLLQWIAYYSLNGILTAGLFTLVSIYYKIMPMSNAGLIFISHYLGFVHVYAMFTMVIQFVNQEELAQGLPWLFGFASIGATVPIVIAEYPGFPLISVLSVLSPFVGMIQYHGIYITYDSLGYNTGIHPGDNVVESGLLGNMMAQIGGICFWIIAILLYSSPESITWMSMHTKKKKISSLECVGRNSDNDEDNFASNFEPLDPGSKVMLSVRGLEHTYYPACNVFSMCDKTTKTTEVLKGLDLDICQGEVFGYLGHNGAGKSTSIEILGTELKLQQGEVTYHFKEGDFKVGNATDESQIRTKIGVCPQHNTSLPEDLTCRETLRLFAYLKGGLPIQEGESIDEAVEKEVARRLEDVQFTSDEDADKQVSTFSGGMKRKVLIAVALLGDPEVVFLDEPTAGLDPYNRRTIWDMIIAAKKDRSIILTTHFLDEADILSDRIGIIKDGKLLTSGSSLFLKHHFGVGYTLKYDAVKPFDVASIIADAKDISEGIGNTYQWQIQHDSEALFPRLLSDLSAAGAKNVTVELTTLEEVFLETGKEDRNIEPEEEANEEAGGESIDLEDSNNKSVAWTKVWSKLATRTEMNAFRKFNLVQMFMFSNAWKIQGTIFLNIVLPMIYVLSVFLVIRTNDATKEKGEMIESPAIEIGPIVWPNHQGSARFFGIPSLDETTPILPIETVPVLETVGEYFDDPTSPFLGGYYDNNMTLQFAQDVDWLALQIGVAILSNFSALVNGDNTTNGIVTSIQQLPYESSAPFRIDLILLPIGIAFGFVGIALVVLDVLLLKGENIIELFRVAGIDEFYAYLGTTSYKVLSTFVPFFLLVISLGVSLESVLFGNGGRWLGTILLMLVFGYSTVPQGLILAKRFIRSDYKSVSNWFPGVYMTLLGMPYSAWASALQALPENREIILIVGDVLCLIPQVGFQRGLGAIIELSLKFNDENLSWKQVWSFEARVWLPILLMLIFGTFEWIYLYRLTTTREPITDLKEEEADALKPVDISGNSDIMQEKERSLTDNSGINARDLVKVFKIKPDKKSNTDKKYLVKRAVKGVSYGIRKNEIYALLGPNGSGKTVTMSMLAGQYTPDHGEVALDGRCASGSNTSINHLYNRCNVAYCPQFDALFLNKSVEDHMKFYTAIRGLDWNESAAKEHVNAIIDLLGLKKYLDKEAKDLSGGYKRRLSLAIALIGYPDVLLIDEVSTGIDPAARREVWDVLKPNLNGNIIDTPAMILSSHYMDECQELGTRIGIQIDGEVTATGTLTRLQELYCTSYFVEISLEQDASEETEDQLIDIFKAYNMEAESYESLPFHFKLRIPFVEGFKHGDTKQLADIFSLLESNKQSLGIKFYAVAPMNLEQIFIDLSRKQFESDLKFESSRENKN